MLSITIAELVTFLSAITIISAFFGGIVKWVNRRLKDIDKLNAAVFDERGEQRYVTRFAFNDITERIMKKLDALVNAVNTINDGQMIMLDIQIETCPKDDARTRLMHEKEKLHLRRGIVA